MFHSDPDGQSKAPGCGLIAKKFRLVAFAPLFASPVCLQGHSKSTRGGPGERKRNEFRSWCRFVCFCLVSLVGFSKKKHKAKAKNNFCMVKFCDFFLFISV
jgi:hypothetical protein